ncbi:hypothetical protein [Arenibaculum pallidiluteum]|uniref:hypothetical protein n=1 Tax=Arenibaculum pallidiluteum TaxID=2812559 RepID=UPI001A97C742|nr:hypothetical protein [Arenibaculum pallidiluteum]
MWMHSYVEVSESSMGELLDEVIAAHGGLARWNAFSTVRARIVAGGDLWRLKGIVEDGAPQEAVVALHEARASVAPFGAPYQRTAFSPGRIAIETTDGEVVAERLRPRMSFEGNELTTRWDPLQRAYFNSYALWTGLTTPFLLGMPGVETREIEPWTEGTEVWRRLRAWFPLGIATHSEVQDFYFGPDLMLRRHDYAVAVAGGLAAAEFVHGYVDVQGLRLPAKLRAYQRDFDDRPVMDRLLASIDLSDIRYA